MTSSQINKMSHSMAATTVPVGQRRIGAITHSIGNFPKNRRIQQGQMRPFTQSNIPAGDTAAGLVLKLPR